MDIISEILREGEAYEKNYLSKYACKYSSQRREKPENKDKYSQLRNCFAHDTDRIIHSKAFSRYMDKTQVFFRIKNDHISRRALHVHMVSRIARTIGRCLHLNEDLIEAVSLGHDIGHTPFGHVGEYKISGILREKNKGVFTHNAQSVRILQKIENHGEGLNLTLAVLDGILGHNGEIESREYSFKPENLSWEKLKMNVERCLNEDGYDRKVFPSTLEGCVVRVSDIISYIGRDFEDAITLGILKRESLPKDIAAVLGNNNHDIIQNLCNDIIINSYHQKTLSFSQAVFDAYKELKQFNYDRIYHCDLIQEQKEKFEKMVSALFEVFMEDLTRKREKEDIYVHFLLNLDEEYKSVTAPERIVADYFAGMTDQYFIKQYESRFIPRQIDYDEIHQTV